MGTEVLRPQDLLVDRFRASPTSFHRRRNLPANGTLPNSIVNRRPSNKRTSPKPDKKKFNETKKVTHGGTGGDARRKDDRSGPSTGQVTLLRRGESLDSLTAKINGGNPPQERKPADDLAVPEQIRLSPPPLPDVYAGSAFFLSPSPRSLPLPSFFNKKQHDPATRDLRRLLRLD